MDRSVPGHGRPEPDPDVHERRAQRRVTARSVVLCAAFALPLGACGAATTDERPAKEVWYEHRLDFLTSHPYEFTCGDERHVNRFGKRTYFALADIERFSNMSRLRAATSIFYAVQEVCKDKPDG